MEQYSFNSDDVLLRGFQDGNTEAFELLWERYHRRVLFFSRRYVDETEAQDITADTFLQLWRKRQDFSHLEGLSRFLFVTARHRCYDLLKHQQVRTRYAAELLSSDNNNGAANNAYFEHEVRMELFNLLEEQVKQLAPKMREVFLLSFRDGLKPAEIARRLKISVKTVKNQKLSAVKILKAAVSGHPLETILLMVLSREIIFYLA